MAPRLYRCENGHDCAGRNQPCPECRTEVIYFIKAEQTGEEEDGILRIITLKDRATQPPPRYDTGIPGFNRVLGGGFPKGAVVLLAGPPGSGKTTLALKATANVAGHGAPCLYVSGEQYEAEVQAMAKRLGARDERIFLAVTKSVEEILDAVAKLKPRVVTIDSVNVMYTTDASDGEMAQIKVATQKLVDAAKHKQRGFTLVLIGHITKDDSIAGPKQLEHLVDIVVTYAETENGRRFLRSGKNRHGPSGEVAVFEMGPNGLIEIPVASALIVTAKTAPERGYVVFPCMENAKPLLIEVESRVSSVFAEGTMSTTGDRRYTGMDGLKMPAIIAALREDAGLDLRGRDIYMEVSSILGESVTDPAIELAAATSIISSADRISLPAGLVVFGIIGLSGKVKPVQRVESRLEAAKASGFKVAILPKQQAHLVPTGIRAIGVSHVKELREIIHGLQHKKTGKVQNDAGAKPVPLVSIETEL